MTATVKVGISTGRYTYTVQFADQGSEAANEVEAQRDLTRKSLTFSWVPILPRKGILAIAAVIDVALQTNGRPISADTLATRHGLPPRHLESVLQSLVRDGILKGIRGAHGGYELARERSGITANDILRAIGTVDQAEEKPNSELVEKVVLPVLSAAELEFRQALTSISLDDMVRQAASIETEAVGTKAA